MPRAGVGSVQLDDEPYARARVIDPHSARERRALALDDRRAQAAAAALGVEQLAQLIASHDGRALMTRYGFALPEEQVPSRAP